MASLTSKARGRKPGTACALRQQRILPGGAGERGERKSAGESLQQHRVGDAALMQQKWQTSKESGYHNPPQRRENKPVKIATAGYYERNTEGRKRKKGRSPLVKDSDGEAENL